MSAWIPGSEIVGYLGLIDFEFAREYVAKGLVPHNQVGQPYMPSAVVEQFIQREEHELAIHEDTARNLSWYDRDEIIANHIEPLQRRIHDLRLYQDSLNGSVWEGFQLPQDQDLARYFIQVLLNSFYRRDEADKYLPPVPAAVPMAAKVEKPPKQQKSRPENRHKVACQAVAQKIWSESPELTIQDMIQREEIADACEGSPMVKNNPELDQRPLPKPKSRKTQGKAILISL